MFLQLPTPSLRRHARGFTLVEILVALVIGMLGVLVIMQVFMLSESQRRSTTSGSDAQNNGAISIYGIQRDLREAGWGLSDQRMIGCNLRLRAGVTLNNMAPVTINQAGIPAGDPFTDTLTYVSGSANGSPEGDGITGQPATAGAAAYPDIYAVQTPTSFAIGDRVIATPQLRASPCTLALANVVAVGAGSTVNVAVSPLAGIVASNGVLFNAGREPRVEVYAIRGGNLTVCDYMVNDCSAAASAGDPTVWVAIGSNIVSLRAEYGRDTSAPMDGTVDAYDQATPATACGWARISGVRMVLVARSAQYEKTAVTTAPPPWAAGATQPIDLSANADWQKYRYRLFETTIPIRNIVWMGAQPGC